MDGTFIDNLSELEPMELWMRVLIATVIIIFSFYIQQSKKSASRLLASENRYHLLVENINMGIVLSDTEHTTLMSNTYLEMIFNKSTSDFAGKRCFMQSASDDKAFTGCPGMLSMKTGKPEVAHGEAILDDGTIQYVTIKAVPVLSSNGRTQGFVEVVQDVTETVLIDQKIKAALKEKEVLLKEIHHRVKNNLQVVMSILNLQSGYIKDEKLKKYIQGEPGTYKEYGSCSHTAI